MVLTTIRLLTQMRSMREFLAVVTATVSAVLVNCSGSASIRRESAYRQTTTVHQGDADVLVGDKIEKIKNVDLRLLVPLSVSKMNYQSVTLPVFTNAVGDTSYIIPISSGDA